MAGETQVGRIVGSFELVVVGEPRGKARPRFNSLTRRTYTDEATVTAEQDIQAAWLQAGRPRVAGAVVLDVELVLERPVDHWRADGSLGVRGLRAVWPLRKPDVDNALKLFADALNELAYRDDALIVDGRARRRWALRDERACTHVRVRSAWCGDPPQIEAAA